MAGVSCQLCKIMEFILIFFALWNYYILFFTFSCSVYFSKFKPSFQTIIYSFWRIINSFCKFPANYLTAKVSKHKKFSSDRVRLIYITTITHNPTRNNRKKARDDRTCYFNSYELQHRQHSCSKYGCNIHDHFMRA
jgi:hypothetical protein